MSQAGWVLCLILPSAFYEPPSTPTSVESDRTLTSTPRLVHKTAPRYPSRIEKDQRVDAEVTVEVLVGSDGSVESAEVLGGAPPAPWLEDAALRAVRHWRYRPAEDQGRPVAAVVVETVRFSTRKQVDLSVDVFVRGAYEAAANPIPPQAAICVLANKSADPLEIQQRLAAKVTGLLDAKGYRVVAMHDADYCVHFDLGSETKTMRMKAWTIVDSERYFHRLVMTVFEAAPFVATGDQTPVWQGGAILDDSSTKDPPEPLKFADVLLLAVLDHFAESLDMKSSRYLLDSPRAMAMRHWVGE